MGWRLVEEILDHCPDIRYREFRVLVALALDARDETRQGMPGMEKLTLQANCGMRQTRAAMAGLKARGIVKTARRSAPGVRAVYEILPLGPVDNSGNGCGYVLPRSGADSEQRGRIPGPTGAAMPSHTQSSSLSHITQSSSTRTRGDLLAVDPSVTEEEINEVLRILASRGARAPAAVLHTEIAKGNGYQLIHDARHQLDRTAWKRESTGDRALREAEALKADLSTPEGTQQRQQQLADALTAWQREHEVPS